VPEIRLVDLPVICRYSLAVRRESAPAEEVLAVLDASRDAVLAAMGRRPAATPRATAQRATGAKAARGSTRAEPAAGETGEASGPPASSSVAARLTPRQPGSRNPVRALAALPRQEGAPPRRRAR
jgi:hypothetical protein